MTWQRAGLNLPVTTVVQPTSECIQRSGTRLEDWSRRWPQVFASMAEPWLGYVGAVDNAYLALWAVEMSGTTGDEEWAANLHAYLRGLNDPESAEFRWALAQSYLYFSENELELHPLASRMMSLATAGYTWARQALWEGAGHPYWQRPSCPARYVIACDLSGRL